MYLTVDCSKKKYNRNNNKKPQKTFESHDLELILAASFSLLFCKVWKWLDLHIWGVMGLVFVNAALQNAWHYGLNSTLDSCIG